MAQTEAQKRAQKKYNLRVYDEMKCKTKKEIIKICKEYAAALELSNSKFIELAMLYCVKNKIVLDPNDEIDLS